MLFYSSVPSKSELPALFKNLLSHAPISPYELGFFPKRNIIINIVGNMQAVTISFKIARGT